MCLPNLKRNKSQNLLLHLTFKSPLFLEPYTILTLADQGPLFKGTKRKKDQGWGPSNMNPALAMARLKN